MALIRTNLYSKGLALAVALTGCLGMLRAQSPGTEPPALTDEISSS